MLNKNLGFEITTCNKSTQFEIGYFWLTMTTKPVCHDEHTTLSTYYLLKLSLQTLLNCRAFKPFTI